MPRGDSKERRKARAARVLARDGKAAEAAESAGVSNQTISRWRKDPEFQAMIDAEKANADHVIHLAPPADALELLPSNWRQLASYQLALAVSPAIRIMTDALQGADVSRAQLDTARWVVERMAIDAPAEQAEDEINTAEDMVAAVADALPTEILRAALAAKGGT